jgi:hypothetical protein
MGAAWLGRKRNGRSGAYEAGNLPFVRPSVIGRFRPKQLCVGTVVDGRDGWEAVVPPFRVDVTHSARTLKSHRGSRRLEANVRYWRGCLTLALASGATETSQQSPATELRRLEHRAKAPVSGAAAPARQVAHLRPGYRCPGAARARHLRVCRRRPPYSMESCRL